MMRALYCVLHKKDNMVNVVEAYENVYCDCGKRARFNEVI